MHNLDSQEPLEVIRTDIIRIYTNSPSDVKKKHPFSIATARAKYRKTYVHEGIKSTIQPDLMDSKIKTIFVSPFKLASRFPCIIVFTQFERIPFTYNTNRFFAPLG